MNNNQIADVFEEMANILEINGEGFFRVNGYRKGAIAIKGLSQDLSKLVKENPDSIGKIEGIGKALTEKIIELAQTGKCSAHQKLLVNFPMGLLDLIKVRGLGPKKVKLFYDSLEIDSIEKLEKAAKENLLSSLPKMGEKSQNDILQAIDEYRKFSKGRFLINVAKQSAKDYLDYLKEFPGIGKLQYAGSLRRQKETIGDVDILATLHGDKTGIMEKFCSYPEVINVLAQGDTKSSVILKNGLQVDFRVVESESFGAALHYFTGSKDHNIKIRDMAKKRNLKVNEYGLFDGEERIAGETEEEMFNALGLHFIPPEMRQGHEEIELTLDKKMPDLPEKATVDFRCQTYENLDELSVKYKSIDINKAVITLRSSEFGPMLWSKIDEVKKLIAKSDFDYLLAVDFAISQDGEVHIPDDFSEKIDFVTASIQVDGRLSGSLQTERIMKVLDDDKI